MTTRPRRRRSRHPLLIVAVVIAIIVAAQNLFWWFHLTHLVIIAGLVAVLVYLLRGRAGRPDGGDDPPRQP